MHSIDMEKLKICTGGGANSGNSAGENRAAERAARCAEINSRNGPHPSNEWVKIDTLTCGVAAYQAYKNPSTVTVAGAIAACMPEFIDCRDYQSEARHKELNDAYKGFDNPDNYG